MFVFEGLFMYFDTLIKVHFPAWIKSNFWSSMVFGSPKRHGRTPQSGLGLPNSWHKPPITNMEPKNWWWLGDVSPFQRGYLFHVSFAGVYPLKIVLGSLFSFGREPVFRNYVISFLGREDQLEQCIYTENCTLKLLQTYFWNSLELWTTNSNSFRKHTHTLTWCMLISNCVSTQHFEYQEHQHQRCND